MLGRHFNAAYMSNIGSGLDYALAFSAGTEARASSDVDINLLYFTPRANNEAICESSPLVAAALPHEFDLIGPTNFKIVELQIYRTHGKAAKSWESGKSFLCL